MYGLIRPPVPRWNHDALKSYSINSVWTPGSLYAETPLGAQVQVPTTASQTTISHGPGGVGLRNTRSDANGRLQWITTSDTWPQQSLPDAANFTMFAVVSLDATTATGSFISVGSTDSRFDNRIAFHSTNGFQSYHVNNGYASESILSVGALPEKDRPIVVVARFSGTSARSIQTIHTSDGQFASQTPTITTFGEGVPTTLFGDVSTPPLGYIYMAGFAYTVWPEDQLYDFLADPYVVCRPKPIWKFYVPASGTTHSGAASLTGTGTLSADGQPLRLATGALSGVGTLSGAFSIQAAATGALSGVGTVSAQGARYAYGEAALSGVGSVAGSFVIQAAASTTLSGVGTLSGDAGRLVYGAGAFSGVGSIAEADRIMTLIMPDADISDGTWTDQSGGSDLYAAIDEIAADDADFIKSKPLASAESDTCSISLAPMTDPGSHTGWELWVRTSVVGPEAFLDFSIYSGAYHVGTITNTPASSTGLYKFSLDAPTVAGIPDFSNLRVEITAYR